VSNVVDENLSFIARNFYLPPHQSSPPLSHNLLLCFSKF
jgi:hypothetical protein